jgi:predicted PurR-regulated permease PerM
MPNWKKSDIFKMLFSLLLISVTIGLFVPFYSEILLAGVFAFAIEPALGRYLQARQLRWKFSVAGILLLMFCVVAGPITVVAYKAYMQFVEISKTGVQNTALFKKAMIFRSQLVQMANQALTSFHLSNNVDLAGLSEEALSRVANFAVGISSNLIYKVPDVLLHVFVFCVALYFFIAEGSMIKSACLRVGLLSVGELNQLVHALQGSSYNTVVTSVSLGGLAAGIVSLGAIFLHGGDWVVVFVITYICSFIPIIGAGPVALALGLFKFVMGATGQALGFLAVAVVVGIVDNLVRPYLISSKDDDLHPVVSLLALIGALEIFGPSGIFLGPVIASTALKVVPIFYPPKPLKTG